MDQKPNYNRLIRGLFSFWIFYEYLYENLITIILFNNEGFYFINNYVKTVCLNAFFFFNRIFNIFFDVNEWNSSYTEL